jgi:hypothetical protein
VHYEEHPSEYYRLDDFNKKIAEAWLELERVTHLQIIPLYPFWFNRFTREKQGGVTA